MVESNPVQGKETLGPQPLLRDVLADLTFKPGRVLPAHVEAINLGVFQDEARKIANQCFLAPANEVVAKIIYTTGEGKVLVPRNAFQGNRIGVVADGVVSLAPKVIAKENKLKYRYIAAYMHAVGNTNLNFSSALGYLLLNDNSMAVNVCAFIVGRTKNTLYFRGQNSPQLDEKEVGEKIRLWIFQRNERLKQVIKPEMDQEEKNSIDDKVDKVLVKQICLKYDLQRFSGDSFDAVLTRQNP